jgi:hypothetical protein
VEALVTANRADFPTGPLRKLGVEVMGPDAYLTELFEDLPSEVTGAALRIAGQRTRPPMRPSELLAALRGAGLHAFPDRVERRLRAGSP